MGAEHGAEAFPVFVTRLDLQAVLEKEISICFHRMDFDMNNWPKNARGEKPVYLGRDRDGFRGSEASVADLASCSEEVLS